MRARRSLLGALAIAGALFAGVAAGAAHAQPFGHAHGQWAAQLVQARGESRREGRGEERGRGGGRGEEGGRGGYRGQPYAPAPRGYGYPGPAYRQPGPPPNYAPPPEAYAPPVYGQPRGYSYAPAPNSLGSGWRPQQGDARRGVREGRMRSLGEVEANIQRAMRGRMLDAGLEPGPDGRPTYRVRWAAAGGRRVDFIVDAATGAIIGQSGY